MKILNKIVNVQNLHGKNIKYPIIDINDTKLEFMFQWDNLLKESNRYITFLVELASVEERVRADNPLKVLLDESSIEIVEKIQKTSTLNAVSVGGDFFVKTSILEYIIKNNQEIIEKKLADSKSKEDEIDNQIIKLQNKLLESKKNFTELTESNQKKIKEELESFEVKIGTIEAKLVDRQNQHNRAILELQDEEDKKRQVIDTLEGNKHTLVGEIEDKRNDIQILDVKIEELRDILKNEEEIMGKKLEKFISFIKDKADTLLKLEFIEQEEYDELVTMKNEIVSDEPFIDFHEELNGNLAEAVSHIQAYLYQNGIVYPRYIIEDFFALIQTNDLIILAGESGSGKTNLIKSFAKAVGGESIIIPVKPNWTSAEDLLGYYNPLEKKYLSTPFLDALFEAKRNPDIPYFICLDEMNLARVEYYFADFLSLLEERDKDNPPEIKLYSEDESSHVSSELKMVLSLIESTKKNLDKNHIEDYVGILEDKEVNQELRRVFGFSDKNSLIKYHSDLKRMLSGILNTPASITFPKNVRIIGAINIDETTHYLSPKILDRAHIMKFDSPLLNNWVAIGDEVKINENSHLKLKFKIEDFGERTPYPLFDMEDDFCKQMVDLTQVYFSPLGVEVGLRTIRQGLHYKKLFSIFNADDNLAFNNFLVHKILPKMTFDGSIKIEIKERGLLTKKDILNEFLEKILEIFKNYRNNNGIDAVRELKSIIKNSTSNEDIVNYWA